MNSIDDDKNSIISNTILNNKSFFNNILAELFYPLVLKTAPYLMLYFVLQVITLILSVIILYKIRKL